MITKSPVAEIQNLAVNPKSLSVKPILNNPNFYLSTFPPDLNDKIFQNNKKTLFWVYFCPKGISTKKSKYNCSSPPVFTYQRYRVDWTTNQKSFQH